ncbi:MAG: hypothetical protein HY525_11495 [Betaproteobacteria bacterium]|nr:hypothetical protein [Betaproteobacteria bacterium]
MKGESEGMEDFASLFARRAEVGADGAEGRGAGDGTETPGGLLPEFRHADKRVFLRYAQSEPVRQFMHDMKYQALSTEFQPDTAELK